VAPVKLAAFQYSCRGPITLTAEELSPFGCRSLPALIGLMTCSWWYLLLRLLLGLLSSCFISSTDGWKHKIPSDRSGGQKGARAVESQLDT
jgi:hypothetical protein